MNCLLSIKGWSPIEKEPLRAFATGHFCEAGHAKKIVGQAPYLPIRNSASDALALQFSYRVLLLVPKLSLGTHPVLKLGFIDLHQVRARQRRRNGVLQKGLCSQTEFGNKKNK